MGGCCAKEIAIQDIRREEERRPTGTTNIQDYQERNRDAFQAGDVEKSVRKAKNRKYVPREGVPSEVWKKFVQGHHEGEGLLSRIWNGIHHKGQIPNIWKWSDVLQIGKNNGQKDARLSDS